MTASSLAFVSAVKRPRASMWLVYVLVSVLAVYTHLFTALVLLAHALSLLFSSSRMRLMVQACASFAAIGVLSLPLLALFYQRTKVPFNPMNWMGTLGLHTVVEVFHRLSGHAEIPGKPAGQVLLIAYFLICLFAVIVNGKTPPKLTQADDRWTLALLLLWLFTPIALLTVASLRQSILQPRYTLICLPPLVLLAAEGIRATKTSWRRAGLIGLFGFLAASQLVLYLEDRAHQGRLEGGYRIYTAAGRNAGCRYLLCFSGEVALQLLRRRISEKLEHIGRGVSGSCGWHSQKPRVHACAARVSCGSAVATASSGLARSVP